MGTAIRHSSQLLAKQSATRRLLLILPDGKPNDLDLYEGRYGVEDTRVAIHETRGMGLRPFCVTMDEKGSSYLPHLFGVNGIWQMRGSIIMQRHWIRIVPHVVDTLLLISAIGLAFSIQQYPFANAWLTSKIMGLVLYIALGFVALKFGKTEIIRVFAWLTAQAVFHSNIGKLAKPSRNLVWHLYPEVGM